MMLLVAGLVPLAAGAATCTAAGNGNWSTIAWSGCAGGPSSGDAAVIPSGRSVTLDVSTPAMASLAVAGTLTLGNNATVRTLTITGPLTVSGTVAVANFTATHVLQIGGNIANTGTFSLARDANSVCDTVFNGVTQTVTGTTRFNDITVNNGSTVTLSDAVTVVGTTDIGGSLVIGNTTGTKTFTGNVSIASGAVWTNAVNEDISMGGSLANDGSFLSGTGTYTFTNAGQQWSGAAGIIFSGSVTVSGTRANATTTTVAGNIGGASTLTNGAGRLLRIGGSVTATLNASASGNTVEYNGTGAQTADNVTYWHLKVSNPTGPVTLSGNVTVLGDLTNDGGFDPASGNRTVTFQGADPQALSGIAATTVFYRIVLDNADGLSLGHDMEVTNRVTLTTGIITTGGEVLYVSNGSAIVGAGASAFVAGNLRKALSTGATVTRAYEIGSTATGVIYTPVTLTASSVTVTGAITVSTTPAEHPAIVSSDVNDTLDVNRYWTVSNTGTVLASYSVSLTFANPSDLDAGVDPLVFIVQRYDGTAWSDATNGSRTANSITASGLAAFGDLAVGTRRGGTPGIGRFNVYESSTAAGAVTGVIRTRIAGVSFTVDVVAVNASGTAINTGFTGTIRVELLDASDDSGAVDANGCRSSWTTVQTVTPDPVMTGGNNGRRAVTLTEANAWKKVRVRVTNQPTATLIGCSTDAFAIRPASFAGLQATDDDWVSAGTSRALSDVNFGTVTHRAGRPFTLRATAVNGATTPVVTTNYADTPGVVTSACAGSACTTTFGTLAITAGFSSGQLDSEATYPEVGAFRMTLVDDSFSSIDESDGSTAVEREIRSSSLDVGRFVPDRFSVTLNTPGFVAGCTSGGFTYVGEKFAYGVPPIVTVTAEAYPSGTTTLYAGNWWRITRALLASTRTYAAATGTLDTSSIPMTDPVVRYSGDGLSSPPAAGTGTVTFSSGASPSDGFFFVRTSPTGAFDADIGLSVSIVDQDGVSYGANPVRFGEATAGNGMPYSGGAEMRFGRLGLRSDYGSSLVPRRVSAEIQYWRDAGGGKGYFARNVDDSCTVIAPANVSLGNYRGLSAGDSTVSIPNGTFTRGINTLILSPPGGSRQGSVEVVVNLADSGTARTCNAFSPSPTASPAGLSYLGGAWCGSDYDRDPTAVVRFGVSAGSGDIIDFREVF